VRFAQGRPADAVETLSAALKLQRGLVAAAPNDNALLFELGQTEFWVGYAAWRAGQFDHAEKNLMAYQEISQRLVARDPANRSWQIEVAYALNNLAILASERKHYDKALALFQQVVTLSRALIKEGPLDAETTASLLGALSWEGSTLISLGRHDEGLARLDEYVAMLRELIHQQPDDRRQQSKLATALAALGHAAIDAGQPAVAQSAAREGTTLSGLLVLSDPDNLDYRLYAAMHLQIDALARFQLRQWDRALASNQLANAEFMAVLGQDRSLVKAQHALLVSQYLAYELAWQTGDVKAAHAVAADAVQEVGGVPRDDSDARIQSVQSHLFALELARFVDHDDAAAAEQSDAVQKALDSISADAAADSDRNLVRLRAIFDLIRGTDHIPDAARPDNASPTSYSVVRFVERHCRSRPAQLSAEVCRAEASRTAPRQ